MTGRKLNTDALWTVAEFKQDIDAGKISINRVAKIAGCSKTSVYRHLERINKEIY